MFVASKDYESALRSVLAEPGEFCVAVAFWGRGADEFLLSEHPRQMKLICNLQSGATNPDTIVALLKNKGVTVKQHDRLHAKVIIGPSSALVGSANLSSNGLNLEGEEITGWEEAGILTQDITQMAAVKNWFAAIWDASRSISKKDLEYARTRWGQRRATRITSPQVKKAGSCFSIQDIDRADLRDREVYLVIYRDSLSDEAKAAFRRKQKETTGHTAKPRKYSPIYEDWDAIPENAELIDLYYDPCGKLKIYGIFKRTSSFDFKRHNGKTGQIVVCGEKRSLLGKHFAPKEAKMLCKFLQPHIAAIWSSEKGGSRSDCKIIALADALDICG